jgi:Flp pilus assembly protein TadD
MTLRARSTVASAIVGLAIAIALVVVPRVRADRAHAAIVAALSRGDVGGAAAAIDRLRRLRPGDRRLPAAEGEWHLLQGRAPLARARFEAAVEAQPRSGAAWARLGYLRALAGDVAGGRAALEQALALDPGLEAPRAHLAHLAAREQAAASRAGGSRP